MSSQRKYFLDKPFVKETRHCLGIPLLVFILSIQNSLAYGSIDENLTRILTQFSFILAGSPPRPAKKQKFNYGNAEFQVPTLSSTHGILLQPQRIPVLSIQAESKIIQDAGTIWDLLKFEEGRGPLRLGPTSNPEAFQKSQNLRILDMPIKMKGSLSDYRVPLELEPFRGTIQDIINYEHSLMPSTVIRQSYAYITIDQGMIEAGQTQRKGGIHVDGFQGSRLSTKNIINHSFVVSNMTPTAFYTDPFEFRNLDPRVHNYFLEMDRQSKIMKPEFTRNFDIYLMDAYSPHEAMISTEDGFRTFIRISYDVKEFDRLGNTHNPLFSYTWNMLPRETHSTLVRYMEESPEESKILKSLDKNRVRIVRDLELSITSFAEKLKNTDLTHYYNFIYRLLIRDFPALNQKLILELAALSQTDGRARKLLMVALSSHHEITRYQAEDILFSAFHLLKDRGNENDIRDQVLEIIDDPRYTVDRESFKSLIPCREPTFKRARE